MINKYTISISIHFKGVLNEKKRKKFKFSYFKPPPQKKLSQLRDDFVENSRNPVGTFNYQIIKSVYYNCKKIHKCFASSISKSSHGRN